MSTRTKTARQDAIATATVITQSDWSVFGFALLGGALLWMAFPPLNLGWLGWLAPIPWLYLALHPLPISRRGYWLLWIASLLHWGVLLQGIRLAHPALYIGWLALSAYLAIYLPLFIGTTRALIFAWKSAGFFAAPIAWVGWEYARAYVASGFSTASLSHTQTEYPLVLQTADLGGAYAISGLMLFVASAMVTWLPQLKRSWSERVQATMSALFLLVLAGYYGTVCLQTFELKPREDQGRERPINVLLVQGCVDTVLDHNPDRPRLMFSHYRELTLQHLKETKQVYDLIVWPESALAYPDFIATPDATPDPRSGLTVAEFQTNVKSFQAEQAEFYQQLMRELNRHGAEQTYLLAGTGTTEFSNHSHASYNTAMLLSPQGKTIYRYYKNHLVMFGEYIPIIDWFPWIYQYTPMPGGLKPGRAPGTFSLHQTPFSTSVCFESTVPHVIRRQALASKPAIVHLNLSNDGWFYGSSILDLHFQSAVLRAVENRLPVLVAANTGISAVIDRAGRVEQRGPRHATALISTSVERTTQTSFYATVLGDWLAFLCCWVNIIFGLWPCWKSYRTPRQSPSGSS